MRELRHLAAALRYPLAWAALFLSLLLAAAAYQFPFNYTLDTGSIASGPYLENFYPPQEAEGRAARWSHAYSYIRLPGTGGNRPLRVTVELNPSRQGVSDPQPVHVTGLVAQDVLYDETLEPNSGWRTLVMDVDASAPTAFAARDLAIELRTDVYRPPDYQGNELGVLVSGVVVEPLPGTGWSLVMPNTRVLLLIGALVLGVYLLLCRAWSVAERPERDPRLFGAIVALVAGIACTLALAANVVGLSIALPLIVLGVLGAYILLLVALYLLPHMLPPLAEEGRGMRRALSYGPLFGLVLAAPVVFSAGFQSSLAYTVDVGSGRDTPFLRGFNPPMFPLPDGSPGDYRYTSARSYITIPGVGSDNVYSVTLRLNPGVGPALGGETRIVANGADAARLRLQPGWQDVAFSVNSGPAQAFNAANLELALVAPAEVVEGGEQRGVMVERVSIEQIEGQDAFSRSPAHEAGLLVGALLLYLLVARSSGLSPGLPACRLAFLATAPAVLVAGWGLFTQRVEVAVALPHLLTTLIAGLAILILSSHLLPRFFPGTRHSALSTQHSALAIAFVLRFGISALPQMRVIDLPYHLKWLRTLIGGDFLALYLPGELSRVPPEWSLDVLIPKSPLFYVAMWPLGLFEGLDLGALLLFAVSLLDAVMVVAIFALVRPVNQRAAIWAALAYAVMPLAFRAFAFGILPTIFAQALTLLVFLVPTLAPEKLRRPLPFVGWTLLLAASLIAFPTALPFNSLVLVILAAGWNWRRAAPRGTMPAMLMGLGLAIALSFVLYYGLYIQPLLTQTLPALVSGVSLGGEELWPGGAAEMLSWSAGYLVNWLSWLLLPVAISVLGIRDQGSAVRSREKADPGVRARLVVLLSAWLVVLVLGMVLNLRFDMIGKHLYYTLPAAAVAAGLILSPLWSRRCARTYARLLVSLAGISLVWYALAFAASRIQ